MMRRGSAIHAVVHAVDLGVDVLERADGTTFEIADPADVNAAISIGLLSACERRFGVEGFAPLIGPIPRKVLIPFLDEVYPLRLTAASPARPMRQVPVYSIPLLRPIQRPTW
jgi:hypothetical protein